MKLKGKRTGGSSKTKIEETGSGVFVVPSHGRLARRGSTEVIPEDEHPMRRGLRDPQSHVG